MIHSRKCEAEYFDAVVDGKKTFEVRMDDPNCRFLVGDFLALNEIPKDSSNGRCCLVEITYVLRDPRFVKEDYCVLGIKPCLISRSSDRFEYRDDVFKVPAYGVSEIKKK